MSAEIQAGKERRSIFITTPLRAAHSLRASLNIDELNYNSVIGFAQADPKAYFIYACLDEVTKFTTACIRWNEFLGGNEDEIDKSDLEAAKVIYRATMESVADEQQMWARKFNELLSHLILFTSTNDKNFYQLYLLGIYLDQYLRVQSDFKEFYSIENENTQHSIDDCLKELENLLKTADSDKFWLFADVDLNKKKVALASARALYKKALNLANDQQKLALGVSYDSGYSSPSRSIHLSVGGISNQITSARIEQEFIRGSLIAMHIVSVAHKLCDVQPTGDALLFEQSMAGEKTSEELFRSISNPEIEVGDLALAYGDSVCLIEDKKFSDYGYCSFKVRYLARPLLPHVTREWLPARRVRQGVSKKTLKNHLKDIFSGVEGASEKIDLMSDEEYSQNIAKVIEGMENSGDLSIFLRPVKKNNQNQELK
ncbi:hypothetical protein AZI87_05875 [Bdellovibrio bacteriovorus]|uniref:Uncharacterized protein n=1 Tax=Bdellovibrio bacteriovorus TaxID=959 RepID=A0A162GR81_BDEBC|nr:hypothetical protein [Bdellovibrio bacteriovorus]KYG68759.1 hypothetical protein AZI87_05875 [Bdellovibrio bacteriovorus]